MDGLLIWMWEITELIIFYALQLQNLDWVLTHPRRLFTPGHIPITWVKT